MPEKKANIVVSFCCEHQDIGVDLEKLKDLAENICRSFDITGATISIAIVGDNEIQKINIEFLNTAAKTDVISFDLSDDTAGAKDYQLVVNADEAGRQAQKRGHDIEAELALYIAHGLLHNLGFNDAKTDEAQKMHDLEDEILQQAGFGIIYNNGKTNKKKDKTTSE